MSPYLVPIEAVNSITIPTENLVATNIQADTTISPTDPSCCSFDGEDNCGGGEFCNESRSNCEDECFPGKWILAKSPTVVPSISPTKRPSPIPSKSSNPSAAPTASPLAFPSLAPTATPSSAPSCCSFDGGEHCGGGDFCNSSQDTCETECFPGQWVVQKLPTSAPTHVMSSMPSETPACCTFDGGQNCGGGDLCNSNKNFCESNCFPGKWVIQELPTPSPTHPISAMPSATPSCCSFDGGETCGGGGFCNRSKSNCVYECLPGEWVEIVIPTATPTVIPSISPSHAPSCCSFDDGISCALGEYCNRSEINCEERCSPGKWVLQVTPTLSPTAIPSEMPSDTPSCCSFDGGKTCTGGSFCNTSKTICEISCSPGEWVKKIEPTPMPTSSPSILPSESPSCCSFDGGETCGSGEFCNRSETNCEEKCSPGEWIAKAKPSPAPTPITSSMPSVISHCCSFDGGKSCGTGDYCNSSRMNCTSLLGCSGQWIVDKSVSSQPDPSDRSFDIAHTFCCSFDGGGINCGRGQYCNSNKSTCEQISGCAGEWVRKIIPTPAPTPTSSTMPSTAPRCCSFDKGVNCGRGMYCNKSQTNCEGRCAGEWTVKAKPTPAPTVFMSSMPSATPSCCSLDGGKSCSFGDYCNKSKTNCIDLLGCAGEWTAISAEKSSSRFPHSKGCCSFTQGVTCSDISQCNQSKDTCENRCDGVWYFVQ